MIQLVVHTLKVAKRMQRPDSVCGEMAGDPRLTRLLLGLGPRSFSMHPAHLLSVKQQVLHSDVGMRAPLAGKLVRVGDVSKVQALLARINED